jgi:hypothetical protein
MESWKGTPKPAMTGSKPAVTGSKPSTSSAKPTQSSCCQQHPVRLPARSAAGGPAPAPS